MNTNKLLQEWAEEIFDCDIKEETLTLLTLCRIAAREGDDAARRVLARIEEPQTPLRRVRNTWTGTGGSGYL